MSKYEPNVLFCDNQGTIALAKNPTHHAKMKHVDVQLHFIRDHIEKGTIKIRYCPTEDMLADLMQGWRGPGQISSRPARPARKQDRPRPTEVCARSSVGLILC